MPGHLFTVTFVQTSHGAPALMDAIRALLRAALAAPHNQQFLLLSESEVSTLAC